MASATLTDKTVKAAKWAGKDFRLCDGNGLYLNVRASSRTWIIRRRTNGTTRVITLGVYPTLSLQAARLKAAEARLTGDVHNATVGDLVKKYLGEVVEREHKRPELAAGYLRRALSPTLLRKRVAEVTKAELVGVIQDYSGRGARTGDQLRSTLKAMFGYATELGWCPGNPVVDVSRRVTGYNPEARARVLTDDELRALWNESHPNARLLRFLVLTGLRIAEGQKGHQDGERWIVPAKYSKNGKAHWIHLTEAAKAQLPFPLTTPTNVQAWLRRWCERAGIEHRFTPHDLRRTAATRMADAGVEPFIIERVLNHTMQGVMSVYNRAEYEPERIEAACALERHILKVCHG